MFTTSTQKKCWTFASRDEIERLRIETDARFRARFAHLVEDDGERGFLAVHEQLKLCRIVTETGIRFSEDFRPAMWPSVRWVAFSYFKRFYLHQSAMEYSPKSVMMACFYLAAKVDEFNVSIDEFVANLRESNMETILSLEPVIMLRLNYQLTVHAPFRPFEGHLLEMKTIMQPINVDLEAIRPVVNEYFQKALLGDAMLLYAPSQIALSALHYALSIREEESCADLMRQFLEKFLGSEEQTEKLMLRLGEIVECVLGDAQPLSSGDNAALQTRMKDWLSLHNQLEKKSRLSSSTDLTLNQGNSDEDDDD